MPFKNRSTASILKKKKDKLEANLKICVNGDLAITIITAIISVTTIMLTTLLPPRVQLILYGIRRRSFLG